jgi:hypothetical protein
MRLVFGKENLFPRSIVEKSPVAEFIDPIRELKPA